MIKHFLFYAIVALLLSACEPHTKQSGFSALLVQEGKAVSHPANLQFPRDHLAHPDYGIEWWYFTANLEDQQGEPIWLQWTLFRIKNKETVPQQIKNSWTDGQFYMAHFSLHSARQHVFREVFASGGVGNVGVDDSNIHINNWQLKKSDTGLPSDLSLSFFDTRTGADVSVQLKLDTAPVYLLQGDKGYSLKHPDTQLASYYYSLPNIRVTGSVSFGAEHKTGISTQLFKVTGQAWYDHEWSSMFLSKDFSGWSWFSIHLEDGSKLTLFTLEPTATETSQNSQTRYHKAWYGALMSAKGKVTKFNDQQIEVDEIAWQETRIGKLPWKWRIRLSEASLDLAVEVRKRQQISPFTIPYYEGAILVTGDKRGSGFVELTR